MKEWYLNQERKNKWKVYQVGELEDVVKNTIEPRKRKKGKMEEEDKKAERDLEILKKYHKKETKSVKKIFITLFLLGALGYIVNFLMGFF